MKVILSIDPIRFPLTGIGRYTYELSTHLKKNTNIDSLKFLSGYRFSELPVCVQSNSSTALSSSSLSKVVLKNVLTRELYRLVSPLLKQYVLRGYSDHVFHGPNFYLPPFDGASVCTFHDLSVFTWAHCHPLERVKYMRKEIALTLKRADMLITDSEYTRQEVAAYFNWPLHKIRAVPLACSNDFRPRPVEKIISVLRKLGLAFQGYSLYVGTIEPRKNLETLLDAYTLLPQSIKTQWPLVMIGYHGWRSEQLHTRIETAVSEGWVKYLGFVEANDLPLIYAGARVFIFPSLYEGFGLPILEAMASGIPVVCSNASTLPEVCGVAAAMCDPLDVDTLSELIKMGLEDDQWRNQAIEKGLLQAASFSWQQCADDTISVYKDALS